MDKLHKSFPMDSPCESPLFVAKAVAERFGERVLCFGNHEDEPQGMSGPVQVPGIDKNLVDGLMVSDSLSQPSGWKNLLSG